MVQILLEEQTAALLAAKAQAQGLTLEAYLRTIAESAPPPPNGSPPANGSLPSRSAFEVAQELGILGSLKGAPPDLSTNPAHLEGLFRE